MMAALPGVWLASMTAARRVHLPLIAAQWPSVSGGTPDRSAGSLTTYVVPAGAACRGTVASPSSNNSRLAQANRFGAGLRQASLPGGRFSSANGLGIVGPFSTDAQWGDYSAGLEALAGSCHRPRATHPPDQSNSGQKRRAIRRIGCVGRYEGRRPLRLVDRPAYRPPRPGHRLRTGREPLPATQSA